jgi:hypothetical protein
VAAWALWALVVLGLAAGFWLEVVLRRAGHADPLDTAVGPTVAMLSAATVGAVLAGRRPHHPVGWLLLAFALSLAANGVAGGYAPYGAPGPAPGRPPFGWVDGLAAAARLRPSCRQGPVARHGEEAWAWAPSFKPPTPTSSL